MSKRTAATPSRTELASQTLSGHFSDSAQQHLDALRGAVESRLAALEEALADPRQGESLAGLILDLTRVATEEALAAASEACLATKAEADRQLADILASAQAAMEPAQTALRSAHATLEQERAISADLRLAVDQAQQEILKQTATLTAREQLEAELRGICEQLEPELTRQRTMAADLQRAVADSEQQLQTERASSAEQRWLAERATERAAELTARLNRETSQAEAAQEQLAADLACEREAAALVQNTLADTQTDVEAERASNAHLRAALEYAEQQLENARSGEAQEVTDAQQELGSARAEVETLRTDLAGARMRLDVLCTERDSIAAELQAARDWIKELEAESTSNASLRAAVEYAEQQLASARSGEGKDVVDAQRELAAARADVETLRTDLAGARMRLDALSTERDSTAAELQAARREIDEARVAKAEFVSPLPPAGTPPEKTDARIVPAKDPENAPAAAPPAAPLLGKEEEWQAVRLADRYVFRKAITVHINGNPGMLFDLSISGCQVLSPAALKPHHTVKVLLPSDGTSIACTGKVVWTRLEPAAAGRPLGYRAGVHFTKPDESAIETFAARQAAIA